MGQAFAPSQNMRRLSMSAKALSNSSPRFGASSTNNNKQLDSTTTNNWTQQQQASKRLQLGSTRQQTARLNNNTNQVRLTILNHGVTSLPSPLIRDLWKHQKPLLLQMYYKILWLATYIRMCFWHMMSYDVIASHDLIKALSCTALGVHSTRTYPLWLVPRSWLRWRVYVHIEPPANTCPLCGEGRTTPGSLAIRWYIDATIRQSTIGVKFWSTKVLQGSLSTQSLPTYVQHVKGVQVSCCVF